MVTELVPKNLNLVEPPNTYNGLGYVCFLDLLGYSKYIEESWAKGDSGINDLLSFRNYLLEIVRKVTGVIHVDKSGNHSHHFCSIRFLSDSIILSLPCSDDVKENVISTNSIMQSALSIWHLCLEKGFTVRGGIDFGPLYLWPSPQKRVHVKW